MINISKQDTYTCISLSPIKFICELDGSIYIPNMPFLEKYNKNKYRD